MTKPIFDVFRDTMMNNPEGSRVELQREFTRRMKSNKAYLDMLARDYFERMAAVWTVHPQKTGGYSFGRTLVSQDKVARMSHPKAVQKPVEVVRSERAAAATRTATAYAELKAKVRSIILLDMVLPNGKALRDATGAECAKAGGFYAEVSKRIRPTQVVDRHLSEGDLQNIRARFYQANKKDAA